MRVLLAEAQALVREGLKHVTLQIDAQCEFIEAADAAGARAVVTKPNRFDVAWFDEALLSIGEISALRRDQPRAALLALTSHRDEVASSRLLAAGVSALVPKEASTDILAAALRLAIAGTVCVCGNPLAHSAMRFGSGPIPGSRRGAGPLNLTSRQYDVVELIARGCTNKAIAADLHIGLRTVKGHVSVVLRALHADNRTDAGRAARRWLGTTMRAKTPAAPT